MEEEKIIIKVKVNLALSLSLDVLNVLNHARLSIQCHSSSVANPKIPTGNSDKSTSGTWPT